MGFNWFANVWLAQHFADYMNIENNNPFSFVRQQIEAWGDGNYAAQITEFAQAISGIVALLPVSFVYLFSIGFALMLVGIVLRIILEVI